MDNQSILLGGIDDLNQIQGSITARDSLRAEIEQLDIKKQRLEKDIQAEEKLLADSIETTVKKRREQISQDFDKEMSKDQNRLKKVKNDRNKAKNKGMSDRIAEETADLSEANSVLLNEIKTVYKQKGIKGICNSNFFYSLYLPKSIREFITFVVTAIIVLILIPSFVTWFVRGFWLIRALVYVIVVAVMVLLYYLGYKYLREPNKETLLGLRIQHNKVLTNKGRIKRIKKEIMKDKDDGHYNLEPYDKDINDIQERIDEIVRRKNNALTEFERTTKPAITEEITNRDIDRIDAIKADANNVSIHLKELEDRQKDIALSISSNYGAYLGNEFLEQDKIAALIKIMEEKRADNIGQAIAVFRTQL